MTSELQYLGQLRTSSVHKNSGNTIITDAPVDNNGKGQAFSPTDLVATSLAACLMTIMGIKAAQMEVNIDGSAASVFKQMASDPRRISGIKVTIHMPPNAYPDKIKKILEHAARTCPVALSLHPDIHQEIIFQWA